MKKMGSLILGFLFLVQAAFATSPKFSAPDLIAEMKLEMELADSEAKRLSVIDEQLNELNQMLNQLSPIEAHEIQMDLLKAAHPAMAKDLAGLMQVIDFDKLDAQEQSRLLMDLANSHGLKGASWNGEVVGMVIGGSVAALLVGFMIYRIGCLVLVSATGEYNRCVNGGGN